jgi:Probable zinc-ribbon domain
VKRRCFGVVLTGKSGKQRAEDLKVRRIARIAKRADRIRDAIHESHQAAKRAFGAKAVDAMRLAPDNSYNLPEFLKRGYYLDSSFQCRDCGKVDIWSASRQKWWYEVAKGSVWSTAQRCRPCRRRERTRVAEARRTSEEGLQRKAALKAAGKWRTGL